MNGEGNGTVLRSAGWTALTSGVVAAIGIGFLTAMFVSFAVGATSAALAFGRINDVLVLLSYLLAVPSVLAIRAILRQHAPIMSLILALVGIGAITAIVVLQSLLVAGVLTFEEQVGPVSIALLVLGGWFVVSGHLATARGAFPHGARMGLLAATYVGYPIWAIWIGRQFLGPAVSRHPRPLVVSGEPGDG